MWRVIVSLWGIILLILTLGLTIFRQQTPAPPYIVGGNYNGDFWRLRWDGTEQRNLTNGENWHSYITQGTHGKWVYLALMLSDTWLDVSDVLSMRTLIRQVAHQSQWQLPVKDDLLFFTPSGRLGEIYQFDLRDETAISFTDELEWEGFYFLQGSPIVYYDGEWVFFLASSDLGEGGNIFRVRPDGSDLLNITAKLPGSKQNFKLSPDGEWIIFQIVQNESADFFRIRLDGSEFMPLTENAQVLPQYFMTPDGQWIIWQSTDGTFRQTAVDGSKQTRLWNEMVGFFPRLSPDGQWLLFINTSPIGDHLNRLNLASGEVENIASYPVIHVVAIIPPIDFPWHNWITGIGGTSLVLIGLFRFYRHHVL